VTVAGTVIDDQGTIIVPGPTIPPTISPDQLSNFKVYHPGGSEAFSAAYLGQDALTGWHFIRTEERMRRDLVPVTRFAGTGLAGVRMGDELWGIGLRGKDEDFVPYVLSSRVALIVRLPNETAVLAQDIAGPGLPVFTPTGQFAGLAQNSFGQNYLMFSRNQNGTPILLLNVEESSVVLLAGEVLPRLGRIPQTVTGRPVAWMGVYGLQPIDPDVAKLLKLEKQSGVVLSDIMAGSPAAQAGLQDRDIVLAIDGQALPRLKPDQVVISYAGQEIARRRPGDVMTLSILRGTEHHEIKVTLGDEPKMVREASHRYFEKLGLTIREFLKYDGMVNRSAPGDEGGIVVNFLKPNSPAATAGLQLNDWVREIDGVPVKDYAQAIEKLSAIEGDKLRVEFVLLASRGGETQVLRIKLQ
jgi:serine protease Do